MTFVRAKALKEKMPYKSIFYDPEHNCYRLIDPTELYEYKDGEGHYHTRPNASNLQLILA